MASRDDDMLRLITVIELQRRELDRIRASVAEDSVVAMARGALMERLGLSSADAAAQLAKLAEATTMPLAEIAAAVLAEPGRGIPPGSGPGPAGVVPAKTGSARLLDEAAAELAADGAELVGTLATQIMEPLGAASVVTWLLEPDGTFVLLGE